jgi:Na+/melibiose symporter-like transporter
MNRAELTGEPALYATLVATAVQFAAAFWLPWSDEMVGGVNAAVLAAAGVWVAFATRSVDNGGSIKAAILGFVQAAISAAVTFGWDATPEQTVVIMSMVGALAAVFIRQTSKPKSAFTLAA